MKEARIEYYRRIKIVPKSELSGSNRLEARLATSRLRESERKRGTKSRDASESRQKSRLVPPAEY